LDRSTPLTVQRWAFTGFLLIVFVLVIVIRQGVSFTIGGVGWKVCRVGKRLKCISRAVAGDVFVVVVYQ
jgi:hypothetical protein